MRCSPPGSSSAPHGNGCPLETATGGVLPLGLGGQARFQTRRSRPPRRSRRRGRPGAPGARRSRTAGPSGCRQSAPMTCRHHGADATARVGGKSAGSMPAEDERPSVPLGVGDEARGPTKRANCSLDTVTASIPNGATSTSRTGPSPSLGVCPLVVAAHQERPAGQRHHRRVRRPRHLDATLAGPAAGPRRAGSGPRRSAAGRHRQVWPLHGSSSCELQPDAAGLAPQRTTRDGPVRGQAADASAGSRDRGRRRVRVVRRGAIGRGLSRGRGVDLGDRRVVEVGVSDVPPSLASSAAIASTPTSRDTTPTAALPPVSSEPIRSRSSSGIPRPLWCSAPITPPPITPAASPIGVTIASRTPIPAPLPVLRRPTLSTLI